MLQHREGTCSVVAVKKEQVRGLLLLRVVRGTMAHSATEIASERMHQKILFWTLIFLLHRLLLPIVHIMSAPTVL